MINKRGWNFKYLLIFIFLISLFFIEGVCATNYYVNATTGADSNNGTGPATPWKTIAMINNHSFNPGDNIYFERGQTWREQLNVPSSGNSTDYINFSAYGSGANSIIYGSDIISTSWTQYETFSDALTSITNAELGTGQRNYRLAFDANALSSGGTKIRVTVAAADANDGVITNSTIGPMTATHVFDSAPTTITWDGGNAGVTVNAGTTATSDAITFTWTKTNRYGIHFSQSSRAFKYKTTGGWGYGNDYNTDESTELDPAGMSWEAASASLLMITKIEVWNASTGVWSTAIGADPYGVWDNSLPMTYRNPDDIAGVVSHAGHFCYSASNLYIHTSDNTNPNTNGRSYEAAARTENIDDNGKNYIVIDGIDCIQTAGSASTMGGIKLTGSHNTVQNLISHDHRRHCISSYTGCDNSVYDNVTSYNSLSTSVLAIYGIGTDDNIIKNSSLYQSATTIGGGPPIRIHGTAERNIIQNCLIYDANSLFTPTYLVDIYDSGTNGTILRYNKFYGDFSNAIRAQNSAGLEVYYNLFLTTDATSTIISLDASTGSEIYSNSFYGTAAQFALTQINSAIGTLFKNNAVYNGKYISVADGSHTSSVYDNNNYYGGSGNYFNWVGSDYNTFTNWKTNSGQDVNSISSDPLFIDASNNNFTLNSTSPCIDAGTNVNLSQDYRGYFVPQGNAPDIGAYEYLNVTYTTFDGDTTDLTTIDTSNISNFIIEKSSYGKINFSESVNLSGGADLNTHVNISHNRIEINSTALPALNKTARLILYNLTYTDPQILRDGGVCPSSICTEVGYTSDGNFTFTVTQFSVYTSRETPVAEEEETTSGGGGGYPTFKPKQEELEKGYEKTLRKNWKIQFEFDNKTQSIKLNEITNKSVTITVSSEPQTFNLTINETKKLNLNEDDYYDLSIKLKNISFIYFQHKADLVVKSIHEEIPEEEKLDGEEEKDTFLIIFYLLIGIGILILIFILYLIIKKKKLIINLSIKLKNIRERRMKKKLEKKKKRYKKKKKVRLICF